MIKISIRRALNTGWNLFTSRPWFLLGLTLSICVIFVLMSSESVMMTALAYIIYGGYLAVLLKHTYGDRVVFDDLFSLDNRWISFAFLGIIKSVLIFLGLLFFIAPGVYLAVRFMFAELYVMDKGMRPIEALKASSVLTKGHMWKLFFFSLIASLLLFLGFFALIIGALVALVVVTFATISLYRELQTQ